MLRLPLREDGTVDELEIEANPVTANFRRFWPNEPDRSGRIVRSGHGWALFFTDTEAHQPVFPIEMRRLLPGDQVTVERHAGGRWLYRVVELRRIPAADP